MLVVEDDFLIQLDLTLTLEKAGAIVIAASSLNEGLEKVDGEFDVAVLDIRLPDGEVFPVAEKLAARKTPIIFHSGNADEAVLDSRFPNALSLVKPVPEQILVNEIHKHIQSVA